MRGYSYLAVDSHTVYSFNAPAKGDSKRGGVLVERLVDVTWSDWSADMSVEQARDFWRDLVAKGAVRVQLPYMAADHFTCDDDCKWCDH